MIKRHVVQLTDDQRADLEGRFCGRLTLRERNRVQVLLGSDAGDTDEDIADAVGVCVATVVAVRKRFAADGLEAALGERPRSVSASRRGAGRFHLSRCCGATVLRFDGGRRGCGLEDLWATQAARLPLKLDLTDGKQRRVA